MGEIWRACAGGFDVPARGAGADAAAVRGRRAAARRLARARARGPRPPRDPRRDDRHRHLRPRRELRRGRADGPRLLARRAPDQPAVRGGRAARAARTGRSRSPRCRRCSATPPASTGTPTRGRRARARASSSPSSTRPPAPAIPRVGKALELWDLPEESGALITAQLRSVTDGERWKLVDRDGVEELFDLDADPLELAPLDLRADGADDPAGVPLPALRKALEQAAGPGRGGRPAEAGGRRCRAAAVGRDLGRGAGEARRADAAARLPVAGRSAAPLSRACG